MRNSEEIEKYLSTHDLTPSESCAISAGMEALRREERKRHECTVCGDWVDEAENDDGECYHCVRERQLMEAINRLHACESWAELDAEHKKAVCL